MIICMNVFCLISFVYKCLRMGKCDMWVRQQRNENVYQSSAHKPSRVFPPHSSEGSKGDLFCGCLQCLNSITYTDSASSERPPELFDGNAQRLNATSSFLCDADKTC